MMPKSVMPVLHQLSKSTMIILTGPLLGIEPHLCVAFLTAVQQVWGKLSNAGRLRLWSHQACCSCQSNCTAPHPHGESHMVSEPPGPNLSALSFRLTHVCSLTQADFGARGERESLLPVLTT